MTVVHITNAIPLNDKSKLECIKFIRRYGYSTTLTGAIAVHRKIINNEFTCETYMVDAFQTVYKFDPKIVESEKEINERVALETRDANLRKAKMWLETLTPEQRTFVQLLQNSYICTA